MRFYRINKSIMWFVWKRKMIYFKGFEHKMIRVLLYFYLKKIITAKDFFNHFICFSVFFKYYTMDK